MLDRARRAEAIYEQRLRAQLEQTHRDWFVAIEPDAGDYFLGRTMGEAIDAARKSHPSQLPHVLRIGHPVAVEVGGGL
jgi:hypothetical protein